MAENIHIVSCGETFSAHFALALQQKGYGVSCSGCPKALSKELLQGGVKLGTLAQICKAGETVDWVVCAADATDADIKYAESEHLRTMSIYDLLTTHIEGKATVAEYNTHNPSRILSIIHYMLQSQNKKCDYVAGTPATGFPTEIFLSENTRICLLNGDWLSQCNKRVYKSNILILSSLHWRESKLYPTFESYLDACHKVVESIDRNGTLIYNQTVSAFQEWAESVRDDITAIPFKAHACRRDGDKCFLTRSKSETELPFACDEDLLLDLNAARIACRQLGITENAFYNKIASASFLGK